MTWISVNDALPIMAGPVIAGACSNWSSPVLVWPRDEDEIEDTCLAVYCRHRRRWETSYGGPSDQEVTHWMPFPEGPPA